MGFSVAIASFVVLIGFLVFFTGVSAVFFTSINDLSVTANGYATTQQEKLNTHIQLTVNSVSATSCNITVTNIGSTTIFLQNSSGYNWNTIILTYGNSSEVNSYAIEGYQITEIGISGTNTTFNIVTHNVLNPDEQANITLSIPDGAPEILSQDIVSIIFASYYGVTATGETAGPQ